MTNAAFRELMDIRGKGDPESGAVSISGADPVFSTRFKIGETCASVLGAIGVATSDIWRERTGRGQQASIDARHAAATLRSAHYLRAKGKDGAYELLGRDADAVQSQNITQPWQSKDGRWVLPHFGLPHLRDRVLGVLNCEPTPDSVSRAVSQWDALDLENAIDEARACGGMVRANSEWLDHPHGQALAAKPVVEITKIGDSEPEPFEVGPDVRPLSGIRVLDLTRILAGPIAARTLAEHGADVMMVAAADTPQIKNFVMDTCHGKRSCFLDLATTDGVEALQALVRNADVFSQGYRPGVLNARGFGPEQLAALRPGLIYTSINCFGYDGPFKHRGGWEQVAQTVTGICNEGHPDHPALLPAAACDYTTGYLGAYGVLLALAHRAREGGSYHVKVSLCQSGMFIYRQGKTDFTESDMDLSPAEIDAIQIKSSTGHGVLKHLGPVLRLSETQPGWSQPTPVLGSSAPAW
ncbi:MAG: CoA transferase [Rhodospirillaceae bacterium]|jgi:crotonobetainyl-CoA:carnitine CoA-transferase CaiB-like acyl-CoA transferase|nr:CoA transferase [Rhodospirillaceae bacterium]MBT5809255.1 CoA transferase [Rhodospirillaceae bacterium]